MEEENITHELKEKLDEAVEHSAKFAKYIAVTTAILAVIAAIASLLSGMFAGDAILHKNNAILYQSKASDQWNFFQAKSIKENLKENLYEQTQDKTAYQEMKRYEKEKEEIRKNAEKWERKVEQENEQAEHHLEIHHKFALSITFFQIGIALFALSALQKKKALKYFRLLSLIIAFVGLIFFLSGLSL